MMALVLAALFMPACGGGKPAADPDVSTVEITDSALIVDRDTGDYTAVVIVQNNGDSAVDDITVEGTALDKDGGTIQPASDAEGLIGLSPYFGTVQPGERDAWIETSQPFGNGSTILGVFEDIPDTIDWKVTGVRAAKMKKSMGLSITGFEAGEAVTDEDGAVSASYTVTIQNSGDSDCEFSPGTQFCTTDQGDVWVRMIAVYRDGEGKIRGATELIPAAGENMSCAAGESSTFKCFNAGPYFDDPNPELYLSVALTEDDE